MTQCPICGKYFKTITSTHAKSHQTSQAEMRITFYDYNLIFTATQINGQSEKTKQKISKSKVGKPLSESHKKAISLGTTGENNPFYGRKHSLKTREMISNTNSGRISTKETKLAIKNGLNNRTDEEKAITSKKLSDAGKNRLPASIETRQKLSKSLKGRIITQETKNKISNANKGKSCWCKGLTKDTCESLKNGGIKGSETRRKKIAAGEYNPIDNFKNCKNNSKDTKCELAVAKHFDELNIEYIKQYKLTSIDFKNRFYDFYLPKYNMLIEVDGRYWHGGSERKPSNIDAKLYNDDFKNKLAKMQGYKLVRVWDNEVDLVWRIIC